MEVLTMFAVFVMELLWVHPMTFFADLGAAGHFGWSLAFLMVYGLFIATLPYNILKLFIKRKEIPA